MKMSKQSRLKKATYNVIFLGIYQVVVFACNLILPRFILVAYGSEYNGIVSSITQFLNFISILRLGVAGATRVELYKSLATDDNQKTSAIVRATELFMRKIAIIFAIYLLALSIGFPLYIRSSYSHLEVGSLVLIIGLGTFAQYFFGITYSTLLQADQRLYIYNIIQIIATILNTTIACFLVKMGCSIQVVKFASSLVFTASPILLNIYVSNKYKLNKKIAPDFTAIKKRGDVVAHSIANIIHDNTDVVVLTLLTNSKIVSVYAVYNLVMNGLKQLMTIFVSGLESAFGDMWVKKEFQKMLDSLNQYEYFMYSFVSIIFSCAAVLIIPFVRIYTKGVNDVNYIIPVYAFLAVLAQAFYCIRMPYLTVVQAAGRYKETRNGAFAEAAINIVLSVVLTLRVGIIGVIIGTLVANVFRTIQYSYYMSRKMLSRPLYLVAGRLIWTALNFIVIIIVFRSLQNLMGLEINSWTTWIYSGIIAFIVSIIITLITSLIFYRGDLTKSLTVVKRVIRR